MWRRCDRLSGFRVTRGPLPFLGKQPVEREVAGAAVLAEPALAQDAFSREAESLYQRRRGAIAQIDLRLDPTQAHAAETGVEQGGERFLHEALPPMGAAERVAQL